MIITIEQWIEQRAPATIVFAAVVLLALIGYVDHIAPAEVAFLLFYLVPIFLITWKFEKPWGYFAGVASAIVWAIGEYSGSHAKAWVAGWNLVFEVGLFLLFAGLIGSLHEHLFIQRTLNRRLEEAMAEVKQLSGLLPICAWCKKIRDDKGQWHQMEEYILTHADVDFTHSICPDCREKARR